MIPDDSGPEVTTILAFGDSLTYGARADVQARHAHADRWPTTLAEGLGPSCRVIPEGLNGRTTVFADPQTSTLRAGSAVLPTLLASHAPLDLVILMLGTNDVMVSERSARATARGMARLVEIVRSHPYWGGARAPKVLVVAPPPCVQDAAGEITARDLAETRALAARYAALARELSCGFFDGGGVTTGALPDGVHLDAAGSRALGSALVPVVRGMIG